MDVGCGPGVYTERLFDRGLEVVAIDLNDEFVRITSERVPDALVKKMDMRDIDDEIEYDGVWAAASILHLPKQAGLEVMKRIFNSLKEEGVFFLSLKVGEGEGYKEKVRFGTDRKYFSFYSEEELRGVLSDIGFEIDKVDYNESKKTKWINIFAIKK